MIIISIKQHSTILKLKCRLSYGDRLVAYQHQLCPNEHWPLNVYHHWAKIIDRAMAEEQRYGLHYVWLPSKDCRQWTNCMIERSQVYFDEVSPSNYTFGVAIIINSFWFNLKISGIFLPKDHPGAKLSAFGAPTDEPNDSERGAYAALYVAKKMRNV